MTEILIVFLVGLLSSFIGSVPPGTLNLSVLQLGLEGRTKIAWRFAVAVTIIEYPYAWLAIQFEHWLTSNPLVIENFQLITAVVVTALGIGSIISLRKPSPITQQFQSSGFRRGLILSILNPMAIPWWIGVIAYEKSQGWIKLTSSLFIHGFVLGTAVGVMLLLAVLILLSKRLSGYASQNSLVKYLPGVVLLGLGLMAFINYFSDFY